MRAGLDFSASGVLFTYDDHWHAPHTTGEYAQREGMAAQGAAEAARPRAGAATGAATGRGGRRVSANLRASCVVA